MTRRVWVVRSTWPADADGDHGVRASARPGSVKAKRSFLRLVRASKRHEVDEARPGSAPPNTGEAPPPVETGIVAAPDAKRRHR